MSFFSPPLFKWIEPDAYQRRNYLIKGWPKALTTMNTHIEVYEQQIVRADGKSIITISFSNLAECRVSVGESDGEKYYVLTFTPKKTRIWIFSYNCLKETAVGNLDLLEKVLAYLRTLGVAVVDARLLS